MVQTEENTIPEFLERLSTGQIPLDAKVRVTFEDAAPAPAERDPTLALFAQWDDEDSRMTPEQRAENERVYAEIEKNGIPRVRI
jgi:hypothetical protein